MHWLVYFFTYRGVMIDIITDSTCDIPGPLLNRYRISIIPHFIIWNNQQYRDRIDLQPDEFYSRLGREKARPTSSQAGVTDFQKAYEQSIQRGATEIIVLTVSSAMSGAFQIARKAAELVRVPVHAVDGKSPTMSLGWQVLFAARAREAGASAGEILRGLDELRRRLVQFVAMDTLEYLQKGGRIGDAVKWMGTLLQVKPLVSINHETGRVEPVGLARTGKSLVDMMYEKFFAAMKPGSKMHIAVMHGNTPEKACELAERIRTDFNPAELLINITGPVLGINTGPGALALCGYTEP